MTKKRRCSKLPARSPQTIPELLREIGAACFGVADSLEVTGHKIRKDIADEKKRFTDALRNVEQMRN